MIEVYTKPQIDQMGVKIGQEIKKVKEAIPASGGAGGDMTLDDGRVIKQRLITGNLNINVHGVSIIAHGLDENNIIEVSCLIKPGSELIPPNAGSSFDRRFRVSIVRNSLSINVEKDTPAHSFLNGKEFRCLITYLA